MEAYLMVIAVSVLVCVFVALTFLKKTQKLERYYDHKLYELTQEKNALRDRIGALESVLLQSGLARTENFNISSAVGTTYLAVETYVKDGIMSLHEAQKETRERLVAAQEECREHFIAFEKHFDIRAQVLLQPTRFEVVKLTKKGK
jgi:hypothetical protein